MLVPLAVLVQTLAAATDGGADDGLLVVLAVLGVLVGAALLALAVGPRRPGDPADD